MKTILLLAAIAALATPASAQRLDGAKDAGAELQARRDGDARFASNLLFDRPNRGDRFAGDVGIGDSYSPRMVALPARYRAEFRDGDEYYYRYDADRIYQVDLVTGTILRLLDLPVQK
jgi:hypothetical protein